jgi:hypothetical protein
MEVSAALVGVLPCQQAWTHQADYGSVWAVSFTPVVMMLQG